MIIIFATHTYLRDIMVYGIGGGGGGGLIFACFQYSQGKPDNSI